MGFFICSRRANLVIRVTVFEDMSIVHIRYNYTFRRFTSSRTVNIVEGICFLLLLRRRHYPSFHWRRRRCTANVVRPLFLLFNQPQKSRIQGIPLCRICGAAARPTNMAKIIQKVYVSDLAVEHSNCLLNRICHAFLNEKVLIVLVPGHLSSHIAHKYSHQPRFQPILFKVDIYSLSGQRVGGKRFIQLRIVFGFRERGYL